MDTKEAKQFLVQQTAEQAALENVQLTDLERRMMYFTESDSASCENPIELNQEFEARYDTGEYELKISRLLRQAYKRLKDEDAGNLRTWNQAIRTLRKGDHYILVLWDVKPTSDLSPESVQLGLPNWYNPYVGFWVRSGDCDLDDAGDYFGPLWTLLIWQFVDWRNSAISLIEGAGGSMSDNAYSQEL